MSLVEKIEDTLKMPLTDAILIGGSLLAAAGFGFYDGLTESRGLEFGKGRQAAMGIVIGYALAGIVAGTGVAFENNIKIKGTEYPNKTIYYPMNKKKTAKDIVKYSSLAGGVCAGVPSACYLLGRGLGCLVK